MIKYLLLSVVTVAVSTVSLHAGEGCEGCSGKEKTKEKTEEKAEQKS